MTQGSPLAPEEIPYVHQRDRSEHKYLSNYHIWETLVENDSPEIYGKARKRVDCKSRTSPFNRKREAIRGMSALVASLAHVPHLVISFSNEGFISHEQMMEILSDRPHVVCLNREHDRYVGARIGIFNPSGDRVGKVSHTKNREYLFVASKNPAVIQALEREAEEAEVEASLL